MAVSTSYLGLVLAVSLGVAHAAPAPPTPSCASDECSDPALSLLQTALAVDRGAEHALGAVEGAATAATAAAAAAHSAASANATHAQAPPPEPVTTDGTLAKEEVGGAAANTGVSGNAEDDIYAFLSALVANTITGIGCVAVAMVLRNRYPLIYSNNQLAGIAPKTEVTPGHFDWLRLSLNTTTDQSAEAIGLDNAMLLEFCNLGMKVMAIIGLPMICVMGPVNCFLGGNAAGADYLSYLSMGNVVNGSQLYWLHALCVWGVVFTVQRSVYNAQELFMKKRNDWLLALPDARANTILVEGIPESHRSQAKLREFFTEMFSKDAIESVYMVKDTTNLDALLAKLEDSQKGLQQAQAEHKKDGKRPTSRSGEDLIETFQKEIAEMKPKVDEARAVLERAKDTVGETNCWTGFVTFKKRREAEVALSLQYSADCEEWVVSNPPEAKDIRWSDLTQSPKGQALTTFIGLALVVGLYFAYMPLVVGITTISMRINMGPLQPVWAGLAPTLGLQFMIGFLPTFLILIFSAFFNLKAEAYSQQKLQVYYFWFQVVFVLLVTAIGSSVVEFTTALFTDPFAIFGLLGATLPLATHFYMNFLVLQWVTHAMIFMRYVPLSKFFAFSVLFEPEEARKMSEPEDQDYYGLGSRSARFTINLVIGIVYGTLSPPINLLVFINFAVCRVLYGYLIPFAETKKADLGGLFWVTQLEHVFIGNIIYCICMIGVLTGRAATMGPAFVAMPSLLYVIWSFRRFKTAYSWEKLAFQDVVGTATAKTQKKMMLEDYTQPAMTKAV